MYLGLRGGGYLSPPRGASAHPRSNSSGLGPLITEQSIYYQWLCLASLEVFHILPDPTRSCSLLLLELEDPGLLEMGIYVWIPRHDCSMRHRFYQLQGSKGLTLTRFIT